MNSGSQANGDYTTVNNADDYTPLPQMYVATPPAPSALAMKFTLSQVPYITSQPPRNIMVNSSAVSDYSSLTGTGFNDYDDAYALNIRRNPQPVMNVIPVPGGETLNYAWMTDRRFGFGRGGKK